MEFDSALTYAIDDFKENYANYISAGTLPAKVRGLVVEWAELHKDELLGMWNFKDFHKIEPLV